MNLPIDILEFHKLFTANNCKLYVVGGSVRDHIKGKQPHDFDLVTDAIPEKVMNILNQYRTDIQGEQFAVVRVYTDSEPMGYEIATFREDVSKGRDNKSLTQKVRFGDGITIQDDCMRRDLTQNALFYDLDTKEIVDIIGGVDDIKNKIIRCVGDPIKRFNEDRLRIIRTLRFCATNKGSKIDELTSSAIHADHRLFGISEIDDVSMERIFCEFIKVEEKAIKDDDDSYLPTFLNLLNEYDIFTDVFGLLFSKPLLTKSLTLALSTTLLNNDIDKVFFQKLSDCKIPNRMISHISYLIGMFNNGVCAETAYDLNRKMKSIHLNKDILTEFAILTNIFSLNLSTFLKYEPIINGNDLISEGFKGADLGTELKRRESIIFKKLLYGY